MIAPLLPPCLAATLDACLHGQSQSDAARRADTISQTYRSGGTSRGIASAHDALAYAVARMPATYAAVTACLNALLATCPGFAPQTLIDCGAGPGTATWAAREAFPSLGAVAMLDANPALRTLALALADPALPSPAYALGEATQGLAAAEPADLVIASYMIGEIAEAKRAALCDALWRATADTLLVIEPGTPAGYARILALRDRLVAQGARVIAPCPHDHPCPLSAPDWCHFVQRLPRSRAHRALKGAALAFEDEKYSYVALTRGTVERPAARVLDRPEVTKIAVTTKLCTPAGLVFDAARRRDKTAYAAARRRDWGDAVPSGEFSASGE